MIIQKDNKNFVLQLQNELKDKVIFFEKKEGLIYLSKYFITNKYIKNFVYEYQTEIRSHLLEWPYNDNIPQYYESFIYRFANTTKDYIDTAIYLYSILKNCKLKGKKLALAYEIAVLSEAKRGREGKRSRIGLDTLQNGFLIDLEDIIYSIDTDVIGDKEEIINQLVQTLSFGASSAHELQQGYFFYIKTCNMFLTLKNIEEVNQRTSGLASNLLRNFCTYDLNKFNNNLIKYRTVFAKRDNVVENLTKIQLKKNDIVKMIVDIMKAYNKNYSHFLKVLERIDTLNYLNDNIDVKYSFKSWAGLVHWTVMAEGIIQGGAEHSLFDRLQYLQR